MSTNDATATTPSQENMAHVRLLVYIQRISAYAHSVKKKILQKANLFSTQGTCACS